MKLKKAAQKANTPILFLDIDGVLNNASWFTRRKALSKRTDFDPECVSHLNRIIEHTGASIVISSSWRRAFDVVRLRRFLRGAGFRGKVIDVTPINDTERGHEIRAWLDNNPWCVLWAVVDDDSDMPGVDHRFVKTDFAAGLTEHHAAALIRLLTIPTS